MSKLNLLVVDDEPGICSGIARILENFKVSYPFMEDDFEFTINEANTGEDAISFIENNIVDIILLDNKLPGDLQGIDVLDFVNNKQLDIFVIMITSYASLELAVKATKTGAYDFVPKPFTPKELRGSIETVTKQLFLRRMTKKMSYEGKQIRFQFLSVLSHELKAPLNAIEGYLRLMQQGTAGDKIENYQEMIERSLVRVDGMRSLILDMLDLTKIESGKKGRELKIVNLYDIARTSVDTLLPFSIQKDVDVYLNSPKIIEIKADPQEMEIIFNNLLSNAIKYNKKGGRVDFKIQYEENQVVINVQDTGIGMTQAEQSRLFNDFVRIKNEQTKGISGTGLGLSIVKKLVDLYNGKIEVKAMPGQGSSFTIFLNNDI
ncbi:MAG: hybrid sensor histidine kinase/response regulator [Bacteroidota bacterium]|nr:hybrid sensor histidine kinase/response regulator [Bacteroidota bacterium]